MAAIRLRLHRCASWSSAQVFWPENFRINDLCVELQRRGHDVTVLTGWPNYPEGRVFPEFKRDPAAFARLAGTPIVRVPIVPRGTGHLRLVLNYLSFVVSAAVIGSWKLRGRRFDAIFVWESSPITVGLPAIVLRATQARADGVLGARPVAGDARGRRCCAVNENAAAGR